MWDWKDDEKLDFIDSSSFSIHSHHLRMEIEKKNNTPHSKTKKKVAISILLPLRSPNLLKHLHKSLRLLRAANLIQALQRKIRHPRNPHLARLLDLAIDIVPARAALQPGGDFVLGETGLDAAPAQHVAVGKILLVLEVGLEELLHDARLHGRALGQAQRDQSVRVSRRACLAAEAEGDPELFADRLHARGDDRGLGGADDGLEVLPLIDACGGRLRVQVERVPCDSEGVGCARVGGFVERDAAFEFFFADVALLRVLSVSKGLHWVLERLERRMQGGERRGWMIYPGAHRVGDNGNLEVGHHATSLIESQCEDLGE